MDKKLAPLIKEEMDKIGLIFSEYQTSTGLSCRSGCGKCCFKKEIFCSPMELLPLGLKLIQENRAEEVLDLCQKNLENHCVLLNVTDAEKGLGLCSQYEYRPFVCRTFAVAARKDKYGEPELSICKIIKEDHMEGVNSILNDTEQAPPFIEQWKSQLDSLDPAFLENEHPINKSLSMILEKLLLHASLEK